MRDLFSTFNPQTTIFVTFSGNWIASLAPIVILPQSYWLMPGSFQKGLSNVANALIGEIRAALNGLIPGTLLTPLAYFFFILAMNFLGLFPYVFTPSSHPRFTLALALPLWLGSVAYRLVIQFNHNMAHLVPEGTPGALVPLMVVIETVRLFVRPVALAVRLAANIVAGHLLISLLGGQGASAPAAVLMGLICATALLATLESAVACIQAYVFTILRSLYLNDHASLKLRKAGV